MTWPQLTVAFTVVWWLVLFMVLPFGVRPEETPQPGNVESAPRRPRLGLKFAVTTVVALVLTAVIYFVIDSGVVSLRPPAP